MSAPLTAAVEENAPIVAAASDKTTILGVAPFAGTVTSVTYTPDTVLTGANTESRTLSVLNKGASGAGTTAIALLAFVSGVNGAASDEKAITLSGTPADLVVAADDVLAFVSTHVGSTGLADPGGKVRVEISRADSSA